ncbi:cytochrome P450 2J6-like [Neolamprologus brichardi]|uniref:cytochrome P450 2J6-like n=1 Tax=Neolamprologus brichardi TaxID=32507 RepID=UPI0016438222|nr:cytochrome P450 2J6-like [Neolamprologus brichardi]
MFASLVLLWVFIWIAILHFKSRRPKNFPPGPLNVPLLGSIFHLSLENPLKDFEKLRKSYGDVYSIFLGREPAVVINGVKAMKEAMVTKAADFAGRPQGLFVNELVDGKGVIMADYGSKWREQRRFGLTTLRNFGLGKNSMEERIHDEIKHIISTLEKNIGKTMSPRVMFHNAASNIICQVLFARRYTYDDELIKLFVGIFNEVSKIINGPWATLYDSFPIIRNLPLPFQKAFKKMEIYKNLSRRMVSEHRETRVPGEPRDFLDCYLDELEKRVDEESSFSEEELIIYLLNLHFAGTDTTSNTLLTGFLYLMNYPHIQGNTTPPVLIYNQEKFNLLAHL